MTYAKISVLKSGDNTGVGGNKKDRIVIIDTDDINLDSFPERDSSGIAITGDIPLKEGAYMVELYATQNTIKCLAEGAGDPDAKGITQTVEFEHPGNSNDIRAFRQYWMNRNVMILIQRCSSGKRDLFGTPCAPLQMTFKTQDDKDKNITIFTFTSIQKGIDIADYQGNVSFDTVKDTVDADATSVDVVNGPGEYQLTTGTAAAATITTLLNPVNGAVYTLLGSGGSHPSTITSANDFVLASGTTWTALAGSRITFRAFKSGASTWKFFEQFRS